MIVGQTEEGDERSAGTHTLQAAAAIPNATVVVLPELGHVMAFVRSDLVLPPVVAFLDEVTPSREAR
jgi:hypothetical protein